MKVNIKEKHCSNCGAPLTTEICPYCYVATGLDTEYADMEYPVIECKEAVINFWNVGFPMIFAFAFGFGAFMFSFPVFLIGSDDSMNYLFLGVGIFIGLLGILAFVIAMIPTSRYIFIELRGKKIDATVYGYMNDNLLINGMPAQIVKLLVSTNDGLKFILYQLGDVKQPFKINSKIELKVYKDIFLIENKKQYYF